MMRAEFRFTRHGLSSPYDVTVRLEADRADTFSATCAPNIRVRLSGTDAALLGVRAAYMAVTDAPDLAVTIVEIVDHSGATGDLGYKICGEAAMYHLLGVPDRAPFPGYVLGGA